MQWSAILMSIGMSNVNKIARKKIQQHLNTYLQGGGQITYLPTGVARPDKKSFNSHTTTTQKQIDQKRNANASNPRL
jgi:hypothetical protein